VVSGRPPVAQLSFGRAIRIDVATQTGGGLGSVEYRGGRASKGRKAYLNHLDIALGSQGEVDVQLEIARRLTYLSTADYKAVVERVDRVGRLLNGLIRSLQPTDADWT